MWTRIITIAVLMLAIGPSVGQTPSAGETGLHTQRQPYAIESFGAFRLLILEGDFTPKVTLAKVMAKHPTTGVGAVADARGEITIYDGKLIISYGRHSRSQILG